MGIQVLPADFIAGLLLAISMTYIASFVSQEKTSIELYKRIFVAIFFAIIVAMSHKIIFIEYPVQLKMAISGFFSVPALMLFSNIGFSTSNKSEQITNSILKRIFGGNTENKEDKK
jgi:hypothetical protein